MIPASAPGLNPSCEPLAGFDVVLEDEDELDGEDELDDEEELVDTICKVSDTVDESTDRVDDDDAKDKLASKAMGIGLDGGLLLTMGET